MPKVADKVLMYAPEYWGQVERFARFWSTTYSLDRRQQRTLRGVEAHFGKAQRFATLGAKLKPNLELDRIELDEKGYTPADNAVEVATVLEAAIMELYASVDCAAKVLYTLYGAGATGWRDGSTRRLFTNIQTLTGNLPAGIRAQISGARWYRRLLHLRDELTHASTGHVHLDPETQLVRYSHDGVQEAGERLSIDDVFGWLAGLISEVNSFLGSVFHQLNATLDDKPVFQMCGMVDGRVLHRYVVPSHALDFHGGQCGAWAWFDLPENPDCPFKIRCGAYSNKASPQGWETAAMATSAD